MTDWREELAMAVHVATTQRPEKVPHECDYDAADAILPLLVRRDAEQHLLALKAITEQDVAEAYQSAPNWHSVLSSLQCRAIAALKAQVGK
jgi:hypothetical protein